MPTKKPVKKAPVKKAPAKKAPVKKNKPSKTTRTTTLGDGDRNVHLQMALGFFITTLRVGMTDGPINSKEIRASLDLFIYLSSTSKSEYIADAARLMTSSTSFVEDMRSFDERSDEEILLDLGKKLKKLPIEDQYRYDFAIELLGTAVGRASGGGFLKGSAYSMAEQIATGEVHALLWGIKPPLNSVPASYLSFAATATAFVQTSGM